MQWIEIENNDLSGALPASLGNIPNLLYLCCESNDLTGTIPSSIMNNARLWDYSWGYILYGNRFNTYNIKIPAPEFSIKDVAGNTIRSATEYSKNKLTILYQWATWCPTVVEITPKLNKLYEKYRNKGLNIIGVTMEDTTTAIEYFNTNNIEFDNVVIQNGNSIRTDVAYTHNIYSPNFEIGEQSVNGFYPTSVYPSVTIIDSLGNVVFSDIINNPNTFVYVVEKYFSGSNSLDGEPRLLQESTIGDGIELIVMGDAFSEESIKNGNYEAVMRKFIDAFFEEEPFKTYKDLFNVHMVNVVSASDGYENKETALGGWFSSDTEVGGDDFLSFGYALKAVSDDKLDDALIVVVMNSDKYAGTCYMYCNGPSIAYIPVVDGATSFKQLIHHEACGHGFAKLADEYAYENMGAVSSDYVSEIQSQQANWGWWKNVDFTSDLSQIRWKHFINDARYANEGLGAYEGGLTYWTGVWRPTENSIMRYNTGGFNAPSREAIYYRINKLAYGADWEYDYEEFVEWDAKNRKTSAATRGIPYRLDVPKDYKPTHPPVVINKSWRDAK